MREVKESDIPRITEALSSHRREICELNIANIFMWKEFDRPKIAEFNGNTCIMVNPLNEAPYFLEPLCRHGLEDTVDSCLEMTGKLSRVSGAVVGKLDQKKYRIRCLRSQSDYLFSRGELAELKGKKFDAKRNHIRKFGRHHPGFRFEPLDRSFMDMTMELFEKWFKIREESRYFPRMAHNAQKSALLYAFRHFERLGLFGGALVSGGSLLGVMIASRLNGDTASVHFAYADPEACGAPQALLHEACNKVFGSYGFVNLEQDMGIPGLRKAKLSYHPVELIRKFEVTAR